MALGAWSANTLVARGFYAQQMTWLPSLIGSVMVVLVWPLYRVLGEQWGGAGLALASSVAVSVYVIALAVVLRRKMAGPNSPALWPVVVRMLPAVLVAIAAGHSLDDFLADWPALLRGAITGCVALGLTLTVARLLGLPEVSQVVGLLREKLRERVSG